MLEKTCLFISSRLKRAGGFGGAPICNEGAPFQEGCEGDFARDFLLRVGGDTFILLIIVIVLVRKQSINAEQQRSTKAEKQKGKQRQRKAISKKKTTSNQSREEQHAKT